MKAPLPEQYDMWNGGRDTICLTS